VLISLAAGIAIVATFHRKTTIKIVAVGPTTSTASSTPTADSGSDTGSGSSSGSTEATGSKGASTQPGTATTSGAPPRGGMAYDATGCSDCGQTTSPGRCSGWNEAFTNNSTVDITGITFDPPAGRYQVGAPGTPNYHTWPVPDPASVTLNLDIKPSRTQKVRFLTCASAAPPAANAFFVATAPTKFSWQWITGQRGSACFAAACG
jgi:hypothetical protein